MKKIILSIAALVFTVAAMAQQKIDSLIKMNTVNHNFGKIKQGVPVDVYFEITNISDQPVVVENTSAPCGCTTPEKITEPILPGKKAKFKVQYNAAAIAPFTKDINIKLAGLDQPKTVKITGEVLTPEAYSTYVKEKSKTKDSKNN